MSRFWITAFVLLLSATVGCGSANRWLRNGFKIGPNYQTPAAPVANNWIDSADPSVIEQREDLTHWWRVFNDPTLEQLIHAAYQQNLSLRTAGLRVLEARRQRNIAAANLFPQSQTGFGQYTRNQNSTTTATAFPGTPRSFSDWQAGFDLSWEIDVWGRIRRAIESSDAAIDTEIANYDDILVTLVGDVAATYIQLRSFDQRIELAKRNVKFLAETQRIAQEQFEAGKVSEVDVHQATTNLADTRALIPSLRLGRRQALNGLALLLGTTPSALEPILSQRGMIPDAPQQVIVGIPAELLRRRPDIRSAERQIASQSAQIGIAQAELYPQFGLNGEIKVNSEYLNDLFKSASTAGFVAPGFRWNILNYGRLVNNVRVQDLRYQQAILSYENAVLNGHREVEDAMVEFLRSKERATELKVSADAAGKSVDLARFRYEEGKPDFGRLFVLEANLVQRQDQLVSAQADIAIALTRIYKALGGGWELRHEVPHCGRYPIEQIAIPSDRQPEEIPVGKPSNESPSTFRLPPVK